MASSVVFKVKYGDTLRRFNAPLNENQRLEFDMEGLKAKICSLFNFTTDADLKLTYIDEDLDMVALVDEEDLHDVVRQGLNPVRITVQLNTGKAASARSSGTSTPVRPQGRNLNQNVNATFADLLKSVPEPLREPLSKLSAEVASKAATSPVFADLIDSITKVSQSFLNAQHPPQSEQADLAAGKEAGEAQIESLTNQDSSASGDEGVIHKGSCANWDAIQCRSQSSCDRKKTNDIKYHCKRKLVGSVNPFYVIPNGEGSSSGKGTIANDAANKNPHSTEDRNMRSSGECPFSGLAMPQPGRSLFPPVPKAKSFGFANAAGTDGAIFHRGVRCDGCGVLPITGPRFKSKVKDDYDLCRICFEQMGKEPDYVRIDFPAPYRHPWSFKGNQIMNSQPWARPPPLLFPHVGKHMKQFRPKLDSRFIMDVNIIDGTIMAPKTPFTKIWRMRNNGNLPWTRGTQLLWIGGDKFSPTDSVEIEVPVAGFYPENEVDVAVDFVAPELPGRYISYWKMASPSGQKFGQRVWVLVQVDASLSDVASAIPYSLNLNLLPEGTGENLPHALGVDDKPLVDVEYYPTPVVSNHIQKPLVDEQPNHPSSPEDFLCDPFTYPIGGSSSAPLLMITPTTSGPVPAAQVTSSPVMYPTLEADLLNPVPGSTAGLPVEPAVPSQTQVVDDDVEQVLLKELEEMGFKQVDLNKEVLRKNDYNFDLSLDELCNVSEWDLLLGELQGMGFVDRDMNKRVLAKNNGSLKHAVMDLITRERV